MKSTLEIFSNNLRDKLASCRRTQSDLARHLNVTEASVSRWVNGTAMPRPNMLDRICVYLGCTVEELTSDNNVKPVLMPEDVIADEIRQKPQLFRLFIAAMSATDEQINQCIEVLKK